MSYIVLARKYRPRSFAEMVGQSHVVQALGNALTQQRLHHAYLFTGTRGVGKTTVSRILAKSLNCTGADGQGGITATPCGVCSACRDIDAGRYVDYVELDAASNRGVDEISQLLDQSVYKPVLGRFKVYMIDEVHMLSTTAFNAMLKTLEEPPDYLKFVLATTDPQKVPVTVLSRCLQFNLRPMASETVFEHLQTVLTAEAVPYEDAALRLLARGARGSMRDALSLTDQAIAFAGGSLGEAAVRQMLGAVDRGHVVRIVEALAASDGVALVRTVDELRALGLSAAGTLEELAHLAQQLAVLQAVPQAIDATQPDAAQLQALVPLLAADEIQLLYSIALHGRAELALAPDEYSGLVMVLLRMLAFRPMGVATTAAAPAGGRSTEAATPTRSAPLLAERASAARVGVPAAAGAAAIAHVASRPMPPAAVSSPVPQASTAPGAAAATAPTAPTDPSTSRELLRSGSAASATLVAPPGMAPPAPMPARAPVSEQSPVNRQQVSEPSPSLLRAAPVAAPAVLEQSIEAAPWDDEPPWVRDEVAAAPAAPLVEPAVQARIVAPPLPAVANVLDAANRATVASMPLAADDAPAVAVEPAAAPMTTVVVPEARAAAHPAQDRWVAVVQQLFAQGSVAGLVRSLAWQAECIALDEQADPASWTLRVERESLRQSSHRERLQAALTELLGRPQRLEIVPGEALDSAALRDAATKAQAQSDAELVICNDPLVLQLLASYPSARIVPGSIRPR